MIDGNPHLWDYAIALELQFPTIAHETQAATSLSHAHFGSVGPGDGS